MENIEIVVKGHIERDWKEWLDDAKTLKTPEGTTVIKGSVRDQAELFGVLNRFRNLGIRILKVESNEKEIQEDFND